MPNQMSSFLSRRRFLAASAVAGGSILAGDAVGDDIDPRVAKVMASTIGIDMHNHVYPAGTEPHPQPPGGGRGPQGGPAGGRPQSQEEPGPELLIGGEVKRSGLTAVCASFVLDQTPIEKPGEARETYVHWLGVMDAELEKGHMRRALTLKDLQAAHDRGQPTIVQTVEGSQFIEGRLERVEEVYRRGLRHLQLLHERDDIVSPLGDTNTGRPHLGGLTTSGAEVVKECNRLGIVVDLAHASHETVMGALKVTKRPPIVSHTNLDTWTGKNLRMAEMMKPRLISKEHAKVVADAGGVVGVWTKLTDSVAEFVESVKMMVDAIGIDHVGIGSDNDLLSRRMGTGTNRAWPGMTTGFLFAVAGEMLRQGFTAGEIGKIGGGNYCRVFGAATANKA